MTETQKQAQIEEMWAEYEYYTNGDFERDRIRKANRGVSAETLQQWENE